MIAVLLGACGPEPAAGAAAPWADEVRAAPGASDADFGDPTLAVNGARGGGWSEGSFDVYALGLDPADVLEVGWSCRRVVDEPGPDLVVFENAFALADGSRFLDPTVVAVSADGTAWAELPHAFTGDPGDPAWPDGWTGFAGITPVLLHEDDNRVDPFDPGTAGGDTFDLGDLPEGDVRDAILAEGVLAVRLSSAGDSVPQDPAANGPDIDAVYARSWVDAACREADRD